MPRKLAVAIGALGLMAGVLEPDAPVRAQAVQAGTLSCSVASGWGFILGSSRDLRCTYAPVSGPPEHYGGAIDKFGVEIGYMQSAVVLWTVLAPTTSLGPGA